MAWDSGLLAIEPAFSLGASGRIAGDGEDRLELRGGGPEGSGEATVLRETEAPVFGETNWPSADEDACPGTYPG